MSRFLKISLFAGFSFLYIPIFILIFYSFNASKRGAVWGGFSTEWYGKLLQDQQILDAAWISFKVAFLSASGAVIIGTLAAVVLVRMGKFRGRSMFSGLVSAPLVMPEVITGISLLLLFISFKEFLGWPQQRGIATIVIAHTTFTAAFVVLVVQSRLYALDKSLEEASADLGATPFETFFYVTVPIIAPSLAAGWMLAFILSFDDLVIASFTSGPGSTTLPMLIYSKVKIAVSPDVNALATIIVVSISLVIAALAIFAFKNQKQEH
ncbi:ABC transporter permease subunit [Cocleimonas flava]|uniref:Putrescine transport system permease protein n=1 Tax=Cocleimonas flava TaxID=634765 RepID=A0A4R1EYG1_9GAMM|nr:MULTISPECIES: ABC transporter permease subunit [Cocleimonas]MEB8432651.1 ABC transporter permease subunit [Cocleimonas sp. KMM 6892]MEC4715510.1 ABC transporter permease subunit [Cocleimonas sp. KMM 6895]MEC4744872.1 ABC transporter permease subunit [Cocleimonas sp. KMM 6896]TCJ83061.1 putrescine transport system permease protein [Cocleimonas flava]